MEKSCENCPTKISNISISGQIVIVGVQLMLLCGLLSHTVVLCLLRIIIPAWNVCWCPTIVRLCFGQLDKIFEWRGTGFSSGRRRRRLRTPRSGCICGVIRAQATRRRNRRCQIWVGKLERSIIGHRCHRRQIWSKIWLHKISFRARQTWKTNRDRLSSKFIPYMFGWTVISVMRVTGAFIAIKFASVQISGLCHDICAIGTAAIVAVIAEHCHLQFRMNGRYVWCTHIIPTTHRCQHWAHIVQDRFNDRWFWCFPLISLTRINRCHWNCAGRLLRLMHNDVIHGWAQRRICIWPTVWTIISCPFG